MPWSAGRAVSRGRCRKRHNSPRKLVPHFRSDGRTKLRKNFPSDYAWGFDFAPELLARTIQKQVEHFDSVDRSRPGP